MENGTTDVGRSPAMDDPQTHSENQTEDWVARWQSSPPAMRRTMLASIGISTGQRGLRILHAIGVVDVLRAENLPWLAIKSGLEALRTSGVSHRDVLRFGIVTGERAISNYLECLSRAATDKPDAILILAEQPLPDILNDVAVATLAGAVRMPIVLGAPRPAEGSLLHDVAFDSGDSAVAGIAVLERIVDDGLRAQARAFRLRDDVRRSAAGRRYSSHQEQRESAASTPPIKDRRLS